GGGLRRFARFRSTCFVELRRTRVHVRRRVVIASWRPLSVASRQGWFRDAACLVGAQLILPRHRPNETVKLSSTLSRVAEAGRGSYSSADGPEHGRARSLPHGVRRR